MPRALHIQIIQENSHLHIRHQKYQNIKHISYLDWFEGKSTENIRKPCCFVFLREVPVNSPWNQSHEISSSPGRLVWVSTIGCFGRQDWSQAVYPAGVVPIGIYSAKKRYCYGTHGPHTYIISIYLSIYRSIDRSIHPSC